MKAFLLYRDQDFNLQQQLPSHEKSLTQDLELNTLFNAMAADDKFLFEVVKKVFLSSMDEIDAIKYRQDILRDCLKNPSVIRAIYQIPLELIERKKRHWLGILTHYPNGVLSSSIQMMEVFTELLKRLKQITDEHSDQFESEGFKTFFSMIKKELDDEYFAIVENHLKELKFQNGAVIGSGLGKGNEGINYFLCKPPSKNKNWIKGVFTRKSPVYTFYIHPRDDHGARALSELKDRGINLVANALAQSAEHIDSFFNMLRIELAFYVACLNLYERLTQIGEIVTFPQPAPTNERQLSFSGLYDICLALTMKRKIVGNEVHADDKDLVIVTGANQGGKSTFLRSIGLAQLMMQCGMFVPAENFRANLCEGLFTHYKRKEDASMKKGKLDEELSRMSDIVDCVKPNSIMLFNESFAATNEREGSEIARQITTALLEKKIKIFFVTHQYVFAHGLYEKKMKNAIFLRSERKTGGERTFKLIEGEPMQTSYGEDIYHSIFEKPKSKIQQNS
jgi:DNA mismatch repair ATPase MutS